MNMFSVDFTLNELYLLRQSLDVITISGKDAKQVSALQSKLESEIAGVQELLQEMELQKQQELAKALEADKKKSKA